MNLSPLSAPQSQKSEMPCGKDIKRIPQLPGKLMQWLGLLPPIVLMALIFRAPVNVPYFDEWEDDLGGLFIKLKTGHLTFADIWMQHNEGRLVLPKIFFLIVGSWTHWNLIYEIVATFLVICLIAYAIYRLEWPAFSERPAARFVIFFVSSLLLFSPVQYEACLWGMEIILYVPLLCIVSALLIFRSKAGETAKLLCGMALATIATYSFSNGLLVWLVLFPAVIPEGGRDGLRNKPRNALCWLLAFLANVAAYFHDFKFSHNGSQWMLWRNPWPAAKYFFAFLGAPLVDRDSSRFVESAVVIGFATVMIFLGACFWVFRQRRNQSLIRLSWPWLSIGGYGVVSALMASAGRSVLGTEQALSPRYSIFGIGLMIAVVHLVPVLVLFHPEKNVAATPHLLRPGYLLAALAGIVILLHASAFPSNVLALRGMQLNMRLGKANLQFLDVLPPQPAVTGYLFPDYATVKKNADALNKLSVRNDDFIKSTRLADFKLNPVPDCGTIESGEKIGSKIHLSGWAMSADHRAAADCVLFSYEGPGIEPRIVGVMDQRFGRRDLVEQFHSRKYFGAGWEKTIDEQDLPRGKLELQVLVYDVESRQVTPLGKTIVISNP